MDSNSEMPPMGSGGLGIRHIPVHTLTPPISPRENSKQARASRSRVPAASSSTVTATTAVAEPATPKLGSAPKVDPLMASQCLRVLENFAAGKNGWDIFYPNGYTEFMDKAAEVAQELHSKGCTLEIAQCFSVLLLYDLVVLLDDSSSMEYAEGGGRKDKLRDVLSTIAEIYGLAREQGIVSVQFLNGPNGCKDVTLERVDDVHSKIHYGDVTTIGTQLQEKILDPFVLSKTRMERPLLTIVIIDGEVEGEDRGLIKKYIADCIDELRRDVDKTEDAVAFMFARLGNDEGAKTLIRDLNDHETLGKWINCLPGELEYLDEISRKGDGAYWEVIEKLMLGALYPYVDAMDDEGAFSAMEDREMFKPDLAHAAAAQEDEE